MATGQIRKKNTKQKRKNAIWNVYIVKRKKKQAFQVFNSITEHNAKRMGKNKQFNGKIYSGVCVHV